MQAMGVSTSPGDTSHSLLIMDGHIKLQSGEPFQHAGGSKAIIEQLHMQLYEIIRVPCLYIGVRPGETHATTLVLLT